MKSNYHKYIALFRLKAHNIAFWAVAPTLLSKYYYENHIHERIDRLWHIHVNRENNGNTFLIKLIHF